MAADKYRNRKHKNMFGKEKKGNLFPFLFINTFNLQIYPHQNASIHYLMQGKQNMNYKRIKSV